ncbi:MAG: cytochrome b5-like heme/steroid binding domain-containing protein [Candidatus Micrarchaeota archaeon]
MDLRPAAILLSFMLLAGCTINPQDLAKPRDPGGAPGDGDVSGTPSGEGRLTMEDVAKHGIKGDCWLVIGGRVLDVSLFSAHPGGDAYVPYCGTDATAAFNNRDGKGKNHSQAAYGMLDSFAIGILGEPAGEGG